MSRDTIAEINIGIDKLETVTGEGLLDKLHDLVRDHPNTPILIEFDDNLMPVIAESIIYDNELQSFVISSPKVLAN